MIADGYIDANTVFDIGVISKQAAEVVGKLIAGEAVEPSYAMEGRVATADNIADLTDLW